MKPAKAPAGCDLEFQPQRKLDFALVIVQLPVDPAPLRFFRERGVTCATREYKRVDTRSAEAGMIEDIEEFRPEFQQATLSENPQLCILDERKVPIPFRGPGQDSSARRCQAGQWSWSNWLTQAPDSLALSRTWPD